MSNLSPRLLSKITVLAFLCFGGTRFAIADSTISVLGIEAAAGSPEWVATAVTDALRQRVPSTKGFQFVQGRDLVEVKLIYSCADEAPPCMTQAAQGIGASKLVFGNIQPVGTHAYLVTLKLLDAEKGVVESWVSEQIAKDQATAVALRVPAQKWFATLTGQSLPGTVKIIGGVVGGLVALDGVQSGALGADGLTMAGIAPGTHKLVIIKPGYIPFDQEFTLPSGGNVPIAVYMQPILTPPAEISAPPKPLVSNELPTTPFYNNPNSRIAAWAIFGVGLTGVGIGILSSYRIHDINKSLDPYRRFLCTTGAAKGLIACDAKGAFKDEITDPDVIKWRKDQYDLGNTYQKAQWIGYGLGGAALITSGILFYRGYGSNKLVTTQTKNPLFVLLPSLGPRSAGAYALLRY